MKKSFHIYLLAVLVAVLIPTLVLAQVKTNGQNLDLGNGNVINGGATFSGPVALNGGFSIGTTGAYTDMNQHHLTNLSLINIKSGGQIVIEANGGNVLEVVGTAGSSNLNFNGNTLQHIGWVSTSNLYSVNCTGCASDGRFKKDVTTLTNALEKIKLVRGVNFNWKYEEFPEKDFPSTYQIGFIAQELEAVFPQFVHDTPDGTKAVEYAKMTAVLVEAVKEQQTIIEAQQQELEAVKAQLEKVEALNTAYAELISRLDKLESKGVTGIQATDNVGEE